VRREEDYYRALSESHRKESRAAYVFGLPVEQRRCGTPRVFVRRLHVGSLQN